MRDFELCLNIPLIAMYNEEDCCLLQKQRVSSRLPCCKLKTILGFGKTRFASQFVIHVQAISRINYSYHLDELCLSEQ